MLKSEREALDAIKQIVVTQKAKPGVSPERRYPAWFVYCGTNPITGAKVQFTRANRADIERDVDKFYKSMRTGNPAVLSNGSAAPVLRPREALDYREARDALDSAGFAGLTVLEVARQFIRDNQGVMRISLKDAYDEYVSSFPELQSAHVDSIRARVGRSVLALDANRAVCDITPREVAEMMKSEFGSLAPKTFNGNLTYLRSFFEWCRKPVRRYCRENPTATIEKRPEPYEEPKFMTPEDASSLFRIVEEERTRWACHEEIVWWLALNFFAGMRGAEIHRLTGKDVNLDEGWVRVAKPKGYQHGVRPRMVPLTDAAKAWLRAYPLPRAVKPDERVFQSIAKPDDFADHLKYGVRGRVPLTKNCGRHTFVTMHVAAYGDPRKTEILVGTSASMRVNHYMGLATRLQGEAYFAIRPVATSSSAVATPALLPASGEFRPLPA